MWDDFEESPIELIDEIWKQIPEFQESFEIADGMFRSNVPIFDEAMVREILVNTLVHRAYTQRGDIFLNFYPDKLTVVSPGKLPLGVTPQNILNQCRRRNEVFARVFHDLKLMEREGSGFDLMYEKLLTTGRLPPSVREGADSVTVSISRAILKPAAIKQFAQWEKNSPLNQRERIVLGILSEYGTLEASCDKRYCEKA